MQLKNKNILITGGSSGLGKATARKLIEKGANVAITGRSAERLNKCASDLGALAIQADVSKQEDIEKTYKEFLAEFGSLDVLINNAGLARGHEQLVNINREDLEYVYSINVFGAAMMAKEAAKLFVAQNHGHLINIASTAALKGYARGTVYSSSKFALRGMTECWRAELRPHNVRVMLIDPSYVPTAFGTKDGEEKELESGKLSPNEIAHSIVSVLEMDDRGFIPELAVWATNPF